MTRLPAIVVDEQGTRFGRVWRGRVSEIREDLPALCSLAENKAINLNFSGDEVEIRGGDRVGVVALPSGRKLRLETKVAGIRLLEWLAYVGEFPDLAKWDSEQAVDIDGSVHHVLCRLYLDELDLLTRIHLRKDYCSEYVVEPRVRGRIQFNQFSRKPWTLPMIPQVVRIRTLDAEINAVLGLALDAVAPFAIELHPESQRKFAHLRDIWSGIGREVKDLRVSLGAVQAAPPQGYRNSLQIARLILLGSKLDPNAGVGGEFFTLSLAHIWERGLEKIFREIQAETGWHVLPAKARSRPWDDANDDVDANRWMLADLMLEKAGVRMTLDAKYKCDFGNESRNDRFQICAYALGFDSPVVALIYPQTTTTLPRRLLKTVVGGLTYTVWSGALPMGIGPDGCRRQAKTLLAVVVESGDDEMLLKTGSLS